MICDLHPGLEDDSEWGLVGIFTDTNLVAQRRYDLEESGITVLAVEAEDDNIEVYVPNEEKDDAFAALTTGDENSCAECEIQFGEDIEICPVCGAKPVRASGENYIQD